MNDCFIIMPVSTPENVLKQYGDDVDHFEHVLQTLFIPAIEAVGLNPIPPKASGSDIIQAEIIKNLASAYLVLCDMSILNPNVFFEFGIRTALDKPVALVIDDKTDRIPFDTSIINYHQYDSSLRGWLIKDEINALANHLKHTLDKGSDKNALWKYFGVAQIGAFNPENTTVEDKLDLILTKISYIPKLQINPLSLPQAIESVKRQMITQSLEESEGNITQAAAKLGITRRGLQKLLGRIEGANTDQMENE
jgi:hypothetical protein